MTQSGAVRWFRILVGLCLSEGVTEIFKDLPVRSYASWKVIVPLVKNIDYSCQITLGSSEPFCLTFLAHATVSKRAPVRHHLRNQTAKESSQALILSANSGLSRSVECKVKLMTHISSFESSSFVRVAQKAATKPPADVPVITLGSRSASRNSFKTPK